MENEKKQKNQETSKHCERKATQSFLRKKTKILKKLATYHDKQQRSEEQEKTKWFAAHRGPLKI